MLSLIVDFGYPIDDRLLKSLLNPEPYLINLKMLEVQHKNKKVTQYLDIFFMLLE